MTTPLKKTVARLSAHPGPNRKQYVVTLEPGDVIGFRDARTRRTYWTSLAHCYAMAVRQTVAREKADKAAARKAGRKA